MSEETKTAYTCGIDWQTELLLNPGGTKFYPSVEDLKRDHDPVGCGIVKVEIKVVEWTEAQDLTKGSTPLMY